MLKKYAIIIDSHPSTDEKKKRLISNLENLKKQNIVVVLTSRYPCPPEIISKADHFIYQSYQKFHYLDSDILNHMSCENLDPITPYHSWSYFADLRVIDRLVNIQWSIAIVSSIQSAIQLLWAKGYDYGFFLVDDFICPDDMVLKIENIIKKSSGYRNYLIKAAWKTNFSGYFSPWFFGFTIDESLIKKIPKEDLSKNEIFQKYYPNCAYEDFINRIWSSENNFVEEPEYLNEFFGAGNWDLDSLDISKLPNNLHVNTTSSVFIKNTESAKHHLLVLSLTEVPYFEKAHFLIEFKNEMGEIIRNLDLELEAGHFYIELVDWIFEINKKIFLYKKIVGYGTIESSLEDSIIIDMDKIDCYAKLKYYE
jgi:hypothetical protein